MLTRRQLLLGALGLGVAAAVPALGSLREGRAPRPRMRRLRARWSLESADEWLLANDEIAYIRGQYADKLRPLGLQVINGNQIATLQLVNL